MRVLRAYAVGQAFVLALTPMILSARSAPSYSSWVMTRVDGPRTAVTHTLSESENTTLSLACYVGLGSAPLSGELSVSVPRLIEFRGLIDNPRFYSASMITSSGGTEQEILLPRFELVEQSATGAWLGYRFPDDTQKVNPHSLPSREKLLVARLGRAEWVSMRFTRGSETIKLDFTGTGSQQALAQTFCE